MRSKRYKLVLFPGTEDFEFYDLEKDPREMTNLAGVTDYAAAIAEARKTVEDLKREVSIRPEQLPARGAGASPERGSVSEIKRTGNRNRTKKEPAE